MEKTGFKSTPHSVKRWQLNGTEYEEQQVPNVRSETRFSSWTPLNNKQQNLQLFEERVNLLLHWFDLWTDKQRKHLLHALFTRCSDSQLKYCKDLLIETVPVTRVDFTAVLPRFLSLYIMSFLSPLDLSRAAQVSWYWRILAEQDCLWAGRCIRRGWFLPYTPGEKEHGAWKNHYISCIFTLDFLSPREVTKLYGAIKPQRIDPTQGEEKKKEARIRQKIREKLQEERRDSIRTRRAWGSPAKPQRPSSERTSSFSSLSLMLRSSPVGQPAKVTQSLDKVQTLRSDRAAVPEPPLHLKPPSLLMLISNRIPAYELVLSGVKAGVTAVLYDHRGSLSTLLTLVERATAGQPVQKVGLLAPGGTETICLLHGINLSEKTLPTPDHRGFWEKLCSWVAPAEKGGGIDIFCPLAASVSGLTLIRDLTSLTGLEVRAPVGLATGSFQNILSEWSNGDIHTGLWDQQPAAAALQYVCDSVIQVWCNQAQWMEEALEELRRSLKPQLQQTTLQARSRALGFFLWEQIGLDKLCVSKELSEALTEGLSSLSEQEEGKHLEFLSNFLTRCTKKDEVKQSDDEHGLTPSSSPIPKLPQMELDWRGAVVRELHHSECLYLERLSAVLKAYQEPLTAALNSNKTILGFADIQNVFGPVKVILELNRGFEADLHTRLLHWSAKQCVGDVFLKLCSKLRVYSNYFNNYTTALRTVDKVREAKPAFRAFLKMADRTAAAHMFSLQELLLCPLWRIREYVALLQALRLHTHPTHPDLAHIRSALDAMQQFENHVRKLKRNSEKDELIEETERMIHGCPSLSNGNKHLIAAQDVVLLQCPDERIPESLRAYEQVSDATLFLFNDALMLTERSVRHAPFTVSHKTSHTFTTSVALCDLTVREILHSRHATHGFVLEAPHRKWVCSAEQAQEREYFVSALRSAIDSALAGPQ